MVSFDKPEDNKKFAEMHNADFPILSDPDRTIGKKYHVESPRGFYMRHTYYINKDGTIAKIDKAVKADTAGADTVANMKELGFPKKEE